MTKTINVSEENWKYLSNLRVDNNIGTMDEVLGIILTHTKEAIKRKDLEIIKQEAQK